MNADSKRLDALTERVQGAVFEVTNAPGLPEIPQADWSAGWGGVGPTWPVYLFPGHYTRNLHDSPLLRTCRSRSELPSHRDSKGDTPYC